MVRQSEVACQIAQIVCIVARDPGSAALAQVPEPHNNNHLVADFVAELVIAHEQASNLALCKVVQPSPEEGMVPQ